MPWEYTLRDSLRMPPCPRCGSVLGVVRLKGSIYACLDHLPREAWEATWVAKEELALVDAIEREAAAG